MPHAHHRLRPACIAFTSTVVFLAQGCASAQPNVPWQDGRSAGIEAHADVAASDLGIPLYPGAVARKDKPDEIDSLTLAIWGGSTGLKLALAKYLSTDPSERVEAFYRDGLSRFGTVLDCGAAAAAHQVDDKASRCSKPEAGKRTFKVGTSGHERSVTVTRTARGTLIDMARMQTSE